MNRRSFILLLCSVVVVLVVVIFFLTLQQPDNSQVSSTPKASKNGLIITNAEQYADNLDWSVITNVQSAAYRRVVTYGHTGSYNGIIREHSFKTTYATYDGSDPPVQVPQYSFLLDIPTAKQSYAVSFSGGKQYPYSILYVLCPEAGQLIYGNFGCVDEQ